METITNAVSSVATTATKLVYGDQSKTATNETGGKEPVSGQQGSSTIVEPYDQGNAPTPLDTTANKPLGNETGGKEPISGEQGKGTVTEPFDQGNEAKATSGTSDEFLKLNPTLDGPQTDAKIESSGDPKIYTNRQDESYAGMPIVPLNPDAATSGPGTSSAPAAGSTGITDKAGVSEQVWKETPLDDISRSGAPGAGPTAPDNVTPAAPTSSTTTGGDAAIKTTAPDAVTAGASAYGSSTADKTAHTHGVDAALDSTPTKTNDSKTQQGVSAPPKRDTPEMFTPDIPKGTSDTAKPSTDSSRLAGEKAGRKSESGKSPALGNTTSNEEKGGKMSHLKEKLKDKLHIGSKDK